MKINLRNSIAIFWILIFIVGFGSCTRDTDIPIKEPVRYTDDDIKSYADVFKVFWNVMDENYNYFYEQKTWRDGMNWDNVYKEYYPKFAALKNFKQSSTVTGDDVQADADKAKEYFRDIIDPVMDRHFALFLNLPNKDGGLTQTILAGGRKNRSPISSYAFEDKMNYLDKLLTEESKFNINLNDFAGLSLSAIGGRLKSNPEIFYFGFSSFSLSLLDPGIFEALPPDSNNKLLLTLSEIENNPELNAIKDIKAREEVKTFTINIFKQWNAFPESDAYKNFMRYYYDTFKNTEVVSPEFKNTVSELLIRSQSLPAYNSDNTYQNILNNENSKYIGWFRQRMDQHNQAYNLTNLTAVTLFLTLSEIFPKFLNPLHKGDIKKVILDVRGNGGGLVRDFRFFVDRFITKNTIWGYQRTKQGTGRFNYTPWVPMQTQKHKFGIPSEIPIAVLTDKASVSMSEMSTLMLKSQGAVSVGDYTYGGTAGLGFSDDYNGGSRDKVTKYLEFYMPLMATKNAAGEVIEGIGVKPDIYVSPPSVTERAEMKNSPATHKDRTLMAALEYLTKK